MPRPILTLPNTLTHILTYERTEQLKIINLKQNVHLFQTFY